MADGESRLLYGGVPAYPFFGVGSLAEYTTMRAAQVVRIDPSLPLDEFCLTGCGVITGVGAVMNIAEVRPGDTVVVIGCGGVGMNVIQASRASGATKIIAVDGVDEKLDLARKFGATDVVLASDDMAGRVADLEPDGADVVFEVVGSPDLLASAVAMTRVGGATVMVGIPPMGSKVPLDAFTMTGNRRLLGCRGGAVISARDLDRIVALNGSGLLDLGSLIGQRIEFDDILGALKALGRSAFARSVVVF